MGNTNYNETKSEACIILVRTNISNEIGTKCANRSSYKERKGNALASRAEEGRDKLR